MPKKGDRLAYDHNIDRDMTAEIIIYHDLPFQYVEYEKVRARNKYLNPDCQDICRQTAALDVLKRYEIEKGKLIEIFAKHRGRFCFTSDLWLAKPTTMGYLCLTTSFIDDSWRLHSKILAFCDISAPHTGEAIASKILDCLKEWGLEKNVFSMTLDNATANTNMQNIVKGQLQMISGNNLVCDGKFLYVRYCAHILNLIVKDGLELEKELLHDIRESVRYVKASQQRIQSFAACVEREKIKSGAGLSLDVSTRWNSTYEMLVRALNFRKAFESLESFDIHYKSLPSKDDSNRGEKICELLKPFSIITTYFPGSKYPTSNIYFTQVWRIEILLKKYARCDDPGIREIVQRMQDKFDKYWADYNIILAMRTVLDPRLKLEVLEKAYENVDPTTSKEKIEQIKENLKTLFEDYQVRKLASLGVSTSQTPQEIVTESPLEDDIDNLERSIGVSARSTKTHLDMYLDEKRLDRAQYPHLDVLSYWKDNQSRFSDLADMAQDLLTIPITTIASEAAFSIGGRVLTPYKNRLLPEKVQALLCTRNWLRGYAEYEGTKDDNNNVGNEDARKTASCSRSEESSVP